MKPQNEQHQRELAILGYLLTVSGRPYLAGDVLNACKPAAFQHQDTRKIAEAMLSLIGSGRDVDLVSVVGALGDSGQLAGLGGAGALAELAAEYGMAILTETSLLREVAVLASEHRKRDAQTELAAIMRRAQQSGVPAEQVAEDLRGAALALDGGETDTAASLDAQLDEYLNGLDPDLRLPPVRTPWKGVTAILRGGILPGELAVLAARPSVGKSAWALNFAWSVVCSGRTALFQSLEMARQQLFDRLAANIGNVDLGRFREGLRQDERAAVFEAVSAVRGRPLRVFDDTRVTVADIRRRVRVAQRGKKDVGLVVVDYLQLLTPQERTNSREREVAEMSRSLKLMAKDLRVPVLLLAQLNRRSEEAKRPPVLSDLRESGAIEQDADIVIFLHQARAVWHPDEPVQVIVAKGRSSGVGREHLVFQRRHQRFLDSSEAAYNTAVREEETERTRHWADAQGELA